MELTPEASRAAWLNLQATLGPLPKRPKKKGGACTSDDGVTHGQTCGHGSTICEANTKPTPYWKTEDTSSLGASPKERQVEYLKRRA